MATIPYPTEMYVVLKKIGGGGGGGKGGTTFPY